MRVKGCREGGRNDEEEEGESDAEKGRNDDEGK